VPGTIALPSAATPLPADAVQHRIDDLRVARGPLRLQGHLHVGAAAPMPADIALALSQPPAQALPAWDAALGLSGPLARSQLRGRVQVQAEPVQALDIEAVLQPFAAWPLARLNARAHALDIAALLPGGPRTALSGDVVIAMADAAKPLEASARLVNGRPGAWDAGLLPARQLQLTVQADPQDRSQARLERLEAQLGDAAHLAGNVSGHGLWRADGGWQLALNLQALRPDRLDGRAMPMLVDGRIELAASGKAAAGGGPASGPAVAPPGASAATPGRAGSAPGRDGPATRSTAQAPGRAGPSIAPSGPAATASAQGSGMASQAPATLPAAAGAGAQRIVMTADLSGRLLDRAAGPPVQLQAEGALLTADAGALTLDLQRLLARQGNARAEARGQLQRAAADADWQARGTLSLAAFDPRPWLPLDAASPLRRAPSRLNGRAEVDLAWASAAASAPAGPSATASPTASAGAAPKAALTASPTASPTASVRRHTDGDSRANASASARSTPSRPAPASATAGTSTAAAPLLPAGLRGRAELTLAPSVLAGVPVQGEARLRSAGSSASGGDRLQLSLQADAAGNRIAADGRLAAVAARDHWSARIDAPALNRLSPLLQALMPGARGRAGPPASAGSLQAEAVADGRWPRLRTRGTLRAETVVFPGGALRQADARWDLGTAPGATVSLDATLAGLRLDAGERAQQVPSLSVKVSGTAERHQLALQSVIAAAPPAWADTLQGSAAPAAAGRPAAPATATVGQPVSAARPAAGPRTRITLAASGALRHGADGDPLSIAGWRGEIQSLTLLRAESTQPLLHTTGVALDWQAETARQPARVALQPGRAELLGSQLRWARLTWQAGRDRGGRSEPALLDADVSLDPLRIAPLLARLQPSLGWSGDLAISGRAVVRTAPTLHADVTVQRHGGDLSMVQGEQRRTLGLSELKATLQARGTRWRTELRLAGRQVGTAHATVTAQTTGASPWPGTETPIDGQVQLRIADLGVYDPFLPVGWDLSGRVSAEVQLGGRIGAPTYRGTLRGSELGVNNFVEGVRVRDGELLASLNGDSARIERLTARAGEGQLRAQGQASFGADPQARITVTADRFRALGRVDRLLDLSGQATLALQRQAVSVQGRFEVDQGLIDLGRGEAPELSKDVRVIDGPTPGRPPEKQAKAAPARPVQLDLRVDLGQNLRVRGKGVNTLLAGDLRLTAPGGQLDVEGTVRTVGGTYEAYGEKLRIDRGLVTFVGPVANPRLDIQAVRADLRDVEVGVAITGTAQNPRVKLFSSPEMSELDKLSWLTLGRSSAGLASDQSAILQRAALALLAGQRGSAGGEGIAKRLGLDKISVGRGQSGGLSDAVVSLGKQISERFYVGYAQSLDATGGSWELVYKVARRLTVRVQAGEETAVDLVWTWLWG
jgi:autotransporter translocation and assembly factor TamB